MGVSFIRCAAQLISSYPQVDIADIDVIVSNFVNAEQKLFHNQQFEKIIYLLITAEADNPSPVSATQKYEVLSKKQGGEK